MKKNRQIALALTHMQGSPSPVPQATARRDLGNHVVLGPAEYTAIRKLGTGNFGACYLERDNQTGELVCIKYICRSMVNAELRREILNQRALAHPNIVQFKRLMVTPTHVAIVMEHAGGGELYAFLASLWSRGIHLSESKSRCLFQQLISGVAYLHTQKVAHRDLKLENTLLSSGGGGVPQLKICDFGFSKSSSEMASEAKTMVGTACYMPPELVPKPFGGSYTGESYNAKKVDCWACGVFLYAMLFAKYPFGNDDSADLPRYIAQAHFTFPPEIATSEECKDLIRRIFVPDPEQRISVEDIMQHPWYTRRTGEPMPEDMAAKARRQQTTDEAQTMAQLTQLLDMVLAG